MIILLGVCSMIFIIINTTIARKWRIEKEKLFCEHLEKNKLVLTSTKQLSLNHHIIV